MNETPNALTLVTRALVNSDLMCSAVHFSFRIQTRRIYKVIFKRLSIPPLTKHHKDHKHHKASPTKIASNNASTSSLNSQTVLNPGTGINSTAMGFPTKIVYGCGCVVFGGESCHDGLYFVDDPGAALLCGPLNLPLLEVRREEPCYRLECPKQEPFEPWVCCHCEHGPNITSFQCKFNFWQEPLTSPDPDFLVPCNHLRCNKCVSLA